MTPSSVRYEAPGFGIGEVWLEGTHVVWSELPVARPSKDVSDGHPLASRLVAFFAGTPDDFADVELRLDEGFYGACQRVLRGVRRGELVTYGELAALAGRPGAARAAGRFAHATASHRSFRVTASSPPTGSAATADSAWTTSGACSASKMSLSEELRDELAAIAPHRRCCRLAELSALFHAAGAWHLRSHGELAVHLDLSTAATARRSFTLLRDLAVGSEIRTYRRRAFDRATRYQLHVDVDAAARAVLREAGVLSPLGAPIERPPKRVVGRSCCRDSYLRGALLGSGSLSGPRSPHLELRSTGIEGARFLAEVAAAEGVTLAVVERGPYACAYAKAGETIADLLAAAGASETALRLSEHAVVAATRAHANRLANADEGNLVRVTRAAHEQLQAIRALETEQLPPKLREIADLRVRHPWLSLAELAAKCSPPITKAAAHHRMVVLRERARSASVRAVGSGP